MWAVMVAAIMMMAACEVQFDDGKAPRSEDP